MLIAKQDIIMPMWHSFSYIIQGKTQFYYCNDANKKRIATNVLAKLIFQDHTDQKSEFFSEPTANFMTLFSFFKTMQELWEKWNTYLFRNWWRTEVVSVDSSNVHADRVLVCMHTAAGTCVGMEPSPLQYSARNTLSNAFIVSTINYTDTTIQWH